MKIPGLDTVFEDINARGDGMQTTLDEIKDLLVQIEINTRVDHGVDLEEIRFKG